MPETVIVLTKFYKVVSWQALRQTLPLFPDLSFQDTKYVLSRPFIFIFSLRDARETRFVSMS